MLEIPTPEPSISAKITHFGVPDVLVLFLVENTAFGGFGLQKWDDLAFFVFFPSLGPRPPISAKMMHFWPVVRVGANYWWKI